METIKTNTQEGEQWINKIHCGDSLSILRQIPDELIDCVITSPPYWGLRDYGVEGQIGLESSLQEYINKIIQITEELKRVLKKTGTMWWNHGDSYGTGSGSGSRSGSKQTEGSIYWEDNGKAKIPGYEKSLIMQNERIVMKMIDEQKWILRNRIIWYKPNSMPSSACDRFSNDYEPIYFLTKSKHYYFEQQFEKSLWSGKDKRAVNGPSEGGKAKSGNYAINKGGAFRKDGNRNMRSVWQINTKGFSEAHFATFPEDLVGRCIRSGCPEGGIVLDCFMGAGTTALVALKLKRNYIGIELNGDYIKIAEKRLNQRVMI